MRNIDVEGEKFAVLEEGQGDKVAILLHGFPDAASSWAPVAKLLAAAGYKVEMPYMRGYLPSTRKGPFDIDRLAADVIAFAGDRKVYLVGHDWGSVAAHAAAERAPEKFKAMVTLAVPHPRSFFENIARYPIQLLKSWYMFFFQLPWLPERIVPGSVAKAWKSHAPSIDCPQDVVDTVRRSMPAPLEYYRAMPKQLGRRWGTISVPTLNLVGDRDLSVDSRLGQGQERFFTGPFEAQILPDVGHWLHLERTAAVTSRILEWFARY